MNMIENLKTALCTAKVCSDMYKDEIDDGTSNFDHPIMMKPEGMKNSEIEEAFKQARIDYEKAKTGLWKGCYHILGTCSGQGSRRTLMAEKFADALIEQGYMATVYYQID